MTADSPPTLLDIEVANARIIAREALDQIAAKRDNALAWLAAAVVAFNAGALATSVNLADKIDRPTLVASVFLAALLMAFGTGVAFTYSLSTIWERSSDLAKHINTKPEFRDLSKMKDAAAAVAGLTETAHVPIAFGIVTGILTLFGVVSFAGSIQLQDASNDRRCLVLQKDMLSARPRRSDGPDLFQALGCRPQGEGSVYAPPSAKKGNTYDVIPPA